MLPRTVTVPIERLLIRSGLCYRSYHYGINTHVFDIGPSEVQYRTPNLISLTAWKDAGRVVNGDWDAPDKRRRFTDSRVYRAFEKRINEGVEWSETDYYQSLAQSVRDGDRIIRGCSTVDCLDEWFEELDGLWKSIAAHGYKSQQELANENIRDPISYKRYGLDNWSLNEIMVTIGRDGAVLFWDGRHRLSIAKILDVDTIPVFVMIRHSDWQTIRNAYRDANTFAAIPDEYHKYVNHPDLQPLLPQSSSYK